MDSKYRTEQRLCWHNGGWTNADEPILSPLDRSFLYGDGVFETFRTWNGRLFRFENHLQRLRRGLDLLGITEPSDLETTLLAIPDLYDIFNADASIRLTVTRGTGWPEPASDAPNVLLFARPAPADEELSETRAVLSSIRRDEKSPLTSVKCCNWLPSVLALREAKSSGCSEAIMLNHQDVIAEAATSNLFWIKQGKIFTPSTDCGGLPGVMRQAVIGLTASHNLNCEQGAFQVDDLKNAGAAFLTNSVIGIRRLTHFGDEPLNDQESIDLLKYLHQTLQDSIRTLSKSVQNAIAEMFTSHG